MSTVFKQQKVVHGLLALVLGVMLTVGGWFCLAPQLGADQATTPLAPALAEGHEGSFGG
ncbi:MAG: hypothetical protein R2867_23600 [Caldilineaceae bacterium]